MNCSISYQDQEEERSVNDFLKMIKEELGGWTLLNNQPNKLTIIKLLSRLHLYHRVDFNSRDIENEYLFNVAIVHDPLNNTKKIITLRQPTFIKSSKFYTTDTKIYDLFRVYMIKLLGYLNQNVTEQFEKDIKELYDVIKIFSNIHSHNATSRDDDFDYKRISLKRLETELNNVLIL